MHAEALAARASTQGLGLEGGQAPLAIAPRDVGHGADQENLLPAGEAGEGVLHDVREGNKKKQKKPPTTTFSPKKPASHAPTTKKPLFFIFSFGTV